MTLHWMRKMENFRAKKQILNNAIYDKQRTTTTTEKYETHKSKAILDHILLYAIFPILIFRVPDKNWAAALFVICIILRVRHVVY